MYNKCLEYLLDYDPDKAVSKHGIYIRRVFSPLLRLVLPLSTKTKLKIVKKAKLPRRPLIFAATHGYKDDIAHTALLSGRQAHILIGSLPQVMNTFDGIAAWMLGTVFVDRNDKESRRSSKLKMLKVLKYGGNIIIFPEGVWNTTHNLIMQRLFPGVYDIAKQSGALVVPIATHRDGKNAYGILDSPFDITQYDRDEGLAILRDKLSSLKYEIMEKYSAYKRESIPLDEDKDRYWENYVDFLISEVDFYDREIEKKCPYINPDITEYYDAFEHLNTLTPNINNAFLFSKRNHN